MNPADIDTGDGPDITNYVLKRRTKKHDYFSSCLPYPQKGQPVSVSLGDQCPVIGNDMSLGLVDNAQRVGLAMWDNAGTHFIVADTNAYDKAAGASFTHGTFANDLRALGVVHDDKSGLVADLSQATPITINALREAFQLQRLLERDMRSGTRYIEMIKAQFGVTNPDFRLMRSELLCTGSAKINVHPVQQTAATAAGDAGDPQKVKGSMAAFATSSGQFQFNHSFTEHGVLLGLVNVRADITYQQGIPRMFSRRDRLDYYLPVLAGLGEQAVLKKEIYADGSVTDEAVFGYQGRWDEYRYKPNIVSGAMRSNYVGSLDAWHLALDFDSAPPLNNVWIEDNPPLQRVVAVTSEPEIIFDSMFEMRHARVMPTFSIPGMIDHL